MNILVQKLCSIQGRLFELSARQGFESNDFVKAYMNSETAAKFNSAYDRSQWMGEEYLLDELTQTYELMKGTTCPPEVMFWIGYTYSYWAIVYCEPCNKIVKMADLKVMSENYAGLHTVSIDMAIQDLKTQYWSHGNNGKNVRDEVFKKVIKDALNSRGYVTDYQSFLNDASVDVLFFLKNQATIKAYNDQLHIHQEKLKRRMVATYFDFILDLIDKAELSQKEKVEYNYVVRYIARNLVNFNITNQQFAFLDSLESRLNKITIKRNPHPL